MSNIWRADSLVSMLNQMLCKIYKHDIIQRLSIVCLGRGIAILVVGMIPRLLMVYFVVSRNNFTQKEKIFLMLSWIPKATVQVKQRL
jgi:hypothetical protein